MRYGIKLWTALIVALVFIGSVVINTSITYGEDTLLIFRETEDLNIVLQNVELLNEEADLLKSEGDYTNALKHYEEALNLIESNEETLIYFASYKDLKIETCLGLAQCSYALENYSNALKNIDLIDANTYYWDSDVSDNVKKLYYSLKADIFNKLGKKDKAIDCYVMLNSISNFKFYDGKKLFEQKQYKEAIKVLEESLANHPMHIEAYSYLAQSYHLLGNSKKAIEIYDFLIEDHLDLLKEVHLFDSITSKCLDIYLHYGNRQNEISDVEDAIELYLSGIDKVKKHKENSKNDLAILTVTRDLYFQLGYCYFIQEEYDKALDIFQKLEAHANPDGRYLGTYNGFLDISSKMSSDKASDFYLMYAKCHENSGDVDKARTCYMEANKYYKKYPGETFTKGVTYFNNEEFGSAIDTFNESLGNRPYNMEAHFYIAKCYFALGERDHALEIADYIISENLIDLTNTYAFKSVLAQSEHNYQKGTLVDKKTTLQRTLSIISLFLLIALACVTLFLIFRKKKFAYVYALKDLYDEIESMNTFDLIADESDVDITGMDK